MTRRPVVEIHLPRRSGGLLVAVAVAAYTHLLIAVVLLVWGTETVASALESLPTLGVSLVAETPAEAPGPAPSATPVPPAPRPDPVPPPPEPKVDDTVREVPPTEPESKPDPETEPARPEPVPPPRVTPGAEGPSEVEAPGAATAEGGSTVGGLEGVPGVETYNQRIASILSTFIPWRRLVLPPGSAPRVLTVSFIARRQGGRAIIERVVIASPSGHDAFDGAVERAVREMAVVPLPAGEPGDFLSFRYQVVLNAPGR